MEGQSLQVHTVAGSSATPAEPPRPSQRRVVLSRTAITFVGVVGGVVAARALGPQGRGQLAVIQSLVLPICPLFCLTLGNANFYFCAQKPDRLSPLLANSLLVLIVNGGLLALALALTLRSPEWLLAAPLLWSTAALSLTMSLTMGLGRLPLLNKVEATMNIAVMASIAYAYRLHTCDVNWVLLSRIVTNLLGAGVLTLAFSPLIRGLPRPDMGLLRSSLHYGGKLTLAAFFAMLPISFSQMAVTYYQGAKIGGYFAIAVQCCMLSQILPSAFITAFLPRFVQQPRAEHMRELRRLLPFWGGLLLLLQAALALSAGLWVIPLFGPSYAPAIPLLLALAPGYWCVGVQTMTLVTLGSRDIPIQYLLLTGSTALLALALNFLFSRWGALGAAWAFSLTAAYFLLASLLYFPRLPGDASDPSEEKNVAEFTADACSESAPEMPAGPVSSEQG